MCRFGRLRLANTSIIPRLLCVFTLILNVASTDHSVPIEIKLWDSQRSPLAHMVDVTNEFGLKILAEHNFLNDNNIAFSPYGLMGILVALYEGVDGESSYQIQRSMQLPWNRNVMRIGFRDIHRTLKTYFVPEEGFLAGLALNNENVTFNEGYKKILRFYGFDLESDQAPENNNTKNGTSSTTNSSDTTTPNSISTSTSMNLTPTMSTIVTKEETTANPNVEIVDIRGPKEELTTTSPPTTSETVAESTVASGQIATTETTTIMNAVLSTLPIETSTPMPSTVTTSLETTTVASTAPQTSIFQGSSDTTAMSNSNQNEEVATQTITSTVVSEPQTTQVSTESTSLMTESNITISTSSESQSTNVMSSLITESTTSLPTTGTISTLETLERRKRSLVDFIFTNPPYVPDHLIYRSFDIGSDLPDFPEDQDNMFLVNGLRNSQVTYMQYDAVMDHAFLPHLEASALRLPLDSERYYLLVVLPMRRGTGELSRLLARMARESDLSDIYAALRPRRVRAAVPSFTVKGHVTLTTDLQKLGIRDVFEPRQHDFTAMTRQAGVYIRSIEQAVSVTIRKYQHDTVKAGYVPNPTPVYFAATYPFLYFVIDSNIHVALMAGKMVDPLNTRIL